MKLKSLLLFGCLVLWLTYGCEEKGPDPTWKVLINEIKGNYVGTCYIHNMSPMEYFDTLYNQTVTIDNLERIQDNGIYTYKLTDGWFKFSIPEVQFEKDTIDISTLGPTQTYRKSFQFIRSQRFLYSKNGVFPGFGFMITECYCTKQ